MTMHISRAGIDEDGDGFYSATCGCGLTIGPAPDEETLLDMAMEHAYDAGRRDGQEDVAANVREHGA